MAATELSQRPATIDPLRHHEHYGGADPAASPGLLNGKGFDPVPFILLNLVFSAVAFYTGALVIIAQKAQTRTDKANEEASARHRDELSQVQTDLLKRNTELTEQVHTVSETLTRLTEEVHEATCKPGASPA